jgi:Rho GTPase-activating protein RGD1
MSVSPLKDQSAEAGKSMRSLRDAIMDINNEGDLNYFIASHASQVPPRPAELKYERHPVSPSKLSPRV